MRDIHRRVGTAILFESSGGQTDKVAHLPELRFSLGEPELDTTSIDSAALALEGRSYFIRKMGADGFRIGYQPTMKKVVSDRRASLDEAIDVMPAMRKLVEEEFRRGASIPVEVLKGDDTEIPDRPKLTLVVVDPDKTQAVRTFLLAHPDERLHFTPTYSSWLNQVELWFSKIERDLARGIFTSVADLVRKIRRYIHRYNKAPKPIRWACRNPGAANW